MGSMDTGATSPRVLVVDDDADVLASLERGLRLSGFEVATAVDGAEALRSATETRPDAIVLDINMPDLNGYEVCAQLKRDERMRDVPIIFITAHGNARMRIQAMREGAVEFLAKPFDHQLLLKTVRAALDI